MASFLILIGIASFLPFFIHLQWLTGPIVNAILVLILFLSGIRYAVIAACVPSIMAIAGGLLPLLMLPIIPFIIISNILFIYTIKIFYDKIIDENKGYWSGVVAGAGAKYIFLFLSSLTLTKFFIKSPLAGKIITMMNWPQFITALTGGIIAWFFLKWLKRI